MQLKLHFCITFLTIFISTVYTVDIIDHNLLCSEVPRDNISDTDLKTNTFYTLRLKRFPTGVITWTNQVHSSGSRYMQTDNGGSPKYEATEEWYLDSQWAFIPSKFHEGWYHLINRGIPGEYASFIENNRRDSGVNENKFYIFLNPNFSPWHSSAERNYRFLWKPVRQEGGLLYQLKSKALPNAAVTWTEKKYLQNGHYIQLDNTHDAKYEYGGEWYDDTLFSFQAEDEAIRLNLSIFKFQLLDRFSEDNDALEKHEVGLGNQAIFENNKGLGSDLELYTARGHVTERFQIEQPTNIPNTVVIRVDPGVEVATQGSIPTLSTTILRNQLIDTYSFQSSTVFSDNVTSTEHEKEFSVTQRIEIPPCTKYEVNSFVKLIKNYPIDYLIQFKVIATRGGLEGVINEAKLRKLLLKNGMEYISTVDEYTVVAQTRGKLVADFAVNAALTSQGVPISTCFQQLECNSSNKIA